MVKTLTWNREQHYLSLLDQRRLPNEECRLACRTLPELAEAIRTLAVRGAPAIGVAAAYGVVLGVQDAGAREDRISSQTLSASIDELAATRPTAVNLFWALARMKKVGEKELAKGSDASALREALLAEADKIYAEDQRDHLKLGEFGARLIPEEATILTHCNAGALACAEYGTALGVIRAAQAAGKNIKVYADETRPLLQGSRLTTWELLQEKIPVTLICDNMAAHCMAKGMIDLVIVGADRIAANGDTANKIGTYCVALAAQAHDLPFYVAAPTSTIDFSLNDGSQIPIEERNPEEVRFFGEKRTAPAAVKVYNPAFDVTPAALISAIITEKGIFAPDDLAAINTSSHT
ncbi:MAG: S-methyl-5-thioribose-1-phosphate isomerase [Deltaproteobacteria bacterium]|nr:S-methyl-5-thioribose-1-phosphate isomerase [Deltaproteobacteria bacterium]